MKTKRILAAITAAVLAVSMTGCNKTTDVETGNKGVVRWYMPISELAETAEAHKRAQDYIEEKIGVKSELMAVNMGDYESKLQMINASREEYDLSFVSSWMNFYTNNIRRGSLLDITELLPKYAPNTYKNVPEGFWEAAKFDGKIYAAINQQITARGPCFWGAERNVDLLDLNYENETDLIDIAEDYLKKVHEKTDDPVAMAVWGSGKITYGIDEFLGEGLPAVVDWRKPDDIKVFNQYETEDFKRYIKKAREWYLAGYTPQTAEYSFDVNNFIETAGPDEVMPMGGVHPTYKPGLEGEHLISQNYPMAVLKKFPALVNTYSVTSTMTGVSATSDAPENALKVLEIMNNDPELFNLICYGLEGVNYTKVGENRIEPNPNATYSINNWAIASVYNNWLLPGQEDGVWEETDRLNREGNLSPLLGFVVDMEPIKVEFQNCNSVVTEYLGRLASGFVDPETGYAEFMEKLDNAGVDKLISECQRQIDEWLANKK